MELITRLSAAPHHLFEHDCEGLVLAFADGLAILEDGVLDFIVRESIDDAARGPDGRYYCTRGDRILRFDVERGGELEDITATFAGHPRGRGRITCTPDGDLWVEGCTTRRRLNNTFAPTPAAPSTEWAPAAGAADIYGGFWSLAHGERGQQVLVLPANAPDEWQIAWLESGRWEYLAADSVGYIWVAGPEGWRRFCPRPAEAGWQVIADQLPDSQVTAVGYSPDDLVMAAFADGQVVELDASAAGDTLVRALGTTPGPGRCIHTDRKGAIWVATDEGLYRKEAEATAWQRTWEKKRGRLPGGGNHDIFAAECQGRLYVAGGWAGQWGLPVRAHVLDELFAFDGKSEYWEVVSHMYMPRRYNGIAELDGRIWVIGGETRFAGRKGPDQALYLVDIYDPASGTWSAGPSLNMVRTDPFVLTCNDRIYAIGGARHNGGPKLDTVESIGVGESAWRLETPLPEPTRQGHGCVLDNIIYCFSIDGAFAFDTVSGCWDEDLPQPGEIGQGPLAATYQGEVWLIGGFGDKRIRCFDPRTRKWRAGPDLPTAQSWGAATLMKDQLFIVGGAHYSEGHNTVVFDDRTYVLRV